MISLKDNHIALMNLTGTIYALENIDKLIKEYSEDKPSPAYVTFEFTLFENHDKVQFDRAIMVKALYEQREKLTDYLARLGIAA